MKLRYSLSLVFGIIVCLSATAFSQYVPRTVLMEEGTNWSCPPCATLNPYVEKFVKLHAGSIIHLAYHPNWPGADDPMYLNDQTDNMDRVVSYYGISGVPNVTFDGSTRYVPGNPSNLESSFDNEAGLGSPFSLSVDRSVSGTTVTVHVKVTAVGDVSAYPSLKLQVAATESKVDGPGPNGEPYYVNAMRTMMPDSKGTTFSITHGESKDFNFTYPLDPSYNADRMFEIAFIQFDRTKEVLQATSDLPKSSLLPSTPLVTYSSGIGSTDFTIQNDLPQSQTYTVNFLPTGGIGSGTVNGSAQPQIMTVAPGMTATLQIVLKYTAGNYFGGIVTATTITPANDTLTSFYYVKTLSPNVHVAFVDASQDSAKSAPMLRTFSQLGIQTVPMFNFDMNWSAQQYPITIVAANKGVVSFSKAGIENYLNNGGHLFIYGGEIAYGLSDAKSTAPDIDDAFLRRVLHATYVKDSAGPRVVHGVSGDSVSGPFVQPFSIYALNIDNPNQPDEIKPLTGAIPVFYYGSGSTQVAGIRYHSGKEKFVYLSYGLQNASDADRKTITSSIIAWLSEGVNKVESTQTNTGLLLQNYPNPFNPGTTIAYSLTKESNASLIVYDSKGIVVKTLVSGFQSSGPHSVNFDASGLASGTYFYVLRTTDGSVMKAMTLTK